MAISNNSDAFKIHHGMMTTSGIWPLKESSLLYKIRALLSWILAVGLCVTMSMEVIHQITNVMKLSEILYIMVTILASVLKMGVFMYQRKGFLHVLELLNDPMFVSYPDHLDHYMQKTIKTSTFIANFYRYLVFCCVILFAVYPVVDSKPLPFPFPYDLGPYTYFLYVFQIVSIGSCAWNNSCFDTLTTSLMGIAAAHFDILMEKIVAINEENIDLDDNRPDDVTNKMVAEKLKHCIQHHEAIIRLVESVENVFTAGLLVQFATSALVICNTVFHVVLVSSINSQAFMLANYFIIIMVQLFMYCWYGNEVILKSSLVGEACYMFSWYNYGNNVRKYLFVIMERSKRPLAITTLKLSKLSLASFTSILQWSYSCLALMLKMYDKQSLGN